MFGTLKPHRCALAKDKQLEYSRFYCGLCKSLGDGYGTLSRALVGHDAVFIALVADGLLEAGATPDRCRCPMLPVVHRPTVAPDSVAMRYAAAIQMMLGDQWLADRAIEGKTLARMARPLARGYVAEAKETLRALGVSLDVLDGFEQRQASCEVIGESGPREAARPTAEALGYVFTTIAALPGAGEALAAPETQSDLEELGRAVGGVIYWVDALDDLRKDCLNGDFNPCAVRLPGTQMLSISMPRVESCVRLLDGALADIKRIVARLPWRRHREVVTHILCAELPATARRAEAAARAAGEEASRSRAMLLSRSSWPVRASLRIAMIAMVLWAWLVGLRSAFAQDSGRQKTPSLPPGAAPDAGAADAGQELPALPEPSQSPAGTSAPSTAPKPPAPRPTDGPGTSTKPAEKPEDESGSGSGGGSSFPKCGSKSCCCEDCTSWCGTTCKGCCKPCDDCSKCDCCKCNDCCKGGNCCK